MDPSGANGSGEDAGRRRRAAAGSGQGRERAAPCSGRKVSAAGPGISSPIFFFFFFFCNWKVCKEVERLGSYFSSLSLFFLLLPLSIQFKKGGGGRDCFTPAFPAHSFNKGSCIQPRAVRSRASCGLRVEVGGGKIGAQPAPGAGCGWRGSGGRGMWGGENTKS